MVFDPPGSSPLPPKAVAWALTSAASTFQTDKHAFKRLLEREQIKPGILEFASANGLGNCLRREIGISLCPEVAVRNALAQGGLDRAAMGG